MMPPLVHTSHDQSTPLGRATRNSRSTPAAIHCRSHLHHREYTKVPRRVRVH
jgi:hypothetical protein